MVFKPGIVSGILHHREARDKKKLMRRQIGQTGRDDITELLLNQSSRDIGPTYRPFC